MLVKDSASSSEIRFSIILVSLLSLIIASIPFLTDSSLFAQGTVNSSDPTNITGTNGMEFGNTINLDSNTEDTQDKEIAVTGNAVYTVWSNSGNVYFRSSTDGGNTFTETTKVSETPFSEVPKVAASGSNVYVIWNADFGKLFFRASNDNGATFGDTLMLADAGVNPQIAAAGNNVYISAAESEFGFENKNVLFTVSQDNGATFSEVPIIIGKGFDSRIAAPGNNNVYLLLSDPTGDIVFSKSNDSGTSFSNPFILTRGENPKLVTSEGYIYIILETPNGVFFRASNDNGTTFKETVKLGDGELPQIAAFANNVYAVWSLQTDDPAKKTEVFLKASNDNGSTFSEEINLSNNNGDSTNPFVAALGNNVYVVWNDNSIQQISNETTTNTETDENNDILFRESNDNGASFSAETINISNNQGDSTNPEVYTSDENMYVVWDDNTPGVIDILFRAGEVQGFEPTKTQIQTQPLVSGIDQQQNCTLDFIEQKESNNSSLLQLVQTVNPNDIQLYTSQLSLSNNSSTPLHNTTMVQLCVNGFGGETKEESIPLHVVFSIDGSNSMIENDPDNLRLEAAKLFIDKLNPSQGQAGIVSWERDVELAFGLTSDFNTLKANIDNVKSSGGTNLNAGLSAAIQMLDNDTRILSSQNSSSPSPSSVPFSKVIIFLSDGEGEYIASGNPGSFADIARNKGYKVFTIGLNVEDNSKAVNDLIDISSTTDAQYFSSPSAENLESIFNTIFQKVISETSPTNLNVTEVLQPYMIVDHKSFSIPPSSINETEDYTAITWNNISQYAGNKDNKLTANEIFIVTFLTGSIRMGENLPIGVDRQALISYSDPSGKIQTVEIPQAFVNVSPQAGLEQTSATSSDLTIPSASSAPLDSVNMNNTSIASNDTIIPQEAAADDQSLIQSSRWFPSPDKEQQSHQRQVQLFPG